MEKNDVLAVYGTDARQMARAILEAAKIEELDRLAGCAHRAQAEPGDGAARRGRGTTHPAAAGGRRSIPAGEGVSRIKIVEGSWVGDRTQEAFDVCGYRALSERYGVPARGHAKGRFARGGRGGHAGLTCAIACGRSTFSSAFPCSRGTARRR